MSKRNRLRGGRERAPSRPSTNYTPWIACLALGLIVGFFTRGPSERVVEVPVEVEKIVRVEVPVEVEKVIRVEVPVVEEVKVPIPGLLRVKGVRIDHRSFVDGIHEPNIYEHKFERLSAARAIALYRVGSLFCEAGLRLGLNDTGLLVRTVAEDKVVLDQMRVGLRGKPRSLARYQWEGTIKWSDDYLEALGWRGVAIASSNTWRPYPKNVKPATRTSSARNLK